ncbi:MAG: prepilin-type N-terminal cleavage/methylation domain-containing protein [Candidatus Gracilibacteria bacterium]
MNISTRLRKGFTLIELLIVIVIIGILAVGLVPKVIDAPKKARDTVRKTNINNIKIAVESYYADKGFYPTIAGQPLTSLDNLNAALANYFQGSKNPNGTPSSGDYYHYGVSGTCYVLGIKMESLKGGNSATDYTGGKGMPTCTAVSNYSAGAGQYYYVAGGSF